MHCAGVLRGRYTPLEPGFPDNGWEFTAFCKFSIGSGELARLEGRARRTDRKLPGNLLMHSGINLTSLEPRQLLLADVVKHRNVDTFFFFIT